MKSFLFYLLIPAILPAQSLTPILFDGQTAIEHADGIEIVTDTDGVNGAMFNANLSRPFGIARPSKVVATAQPRADTALPAIIDTLPPNIPVTTGEFFWVEDDTLCTLATRRVYQDGTWKTVGPPTFRIAPVWLKSDDAPKDSIMFFLTHGGTVGLYDPNIKQLRSQPAARLIRARTELACVSSTVYTIDVNTEKRLIYFASDDGRTKVLRVLTAGASEDSVFYEGQ